MRPSEREVLLMQSKSIDTSQLATASDEDLIDVLIAISVVAKRLARKLQIEKTREGDEKNGKNE